MNGGVLTHKEMVEQINSFIESQKGYAYPESRNLPLDCNREGVLYHPDVVVTKDENITHIIEPETSTGGTTIIGKILLANKCIDIMVNKNKTQSGNVKPKLVFLYKDKELFPKTRLERVRKRVDEVELKTGYLSEVQIDYFPAGWNWFD